MRFWKNYALYLPIVVSVIFGGCLLILAFAHAVDNYVHPWLVMHLGEHAPLVWVGVALLAVSMVVAAIVTIEKA